MAKLIEPSTAPPKLRGPYKKLPAMKDFIRIELELALTFVKVALTRFSMGHIANGDISRNNAEEAYRSALKYLGKCDISPLEREKFMALVNQAKDAIATLPNR